MLQLDSIAVRILAFLARKAARSLGRWLDALDIDIFGGRKCSPSQLFHATCFAPHGITHNFMTADDIHRRLTVSSTVLSRFILP